MVNYRLKYFNGRGLGEIPRQLFILADQPFEDVRVTEEEFVILKPTLPFGQLPLLEFDDHRLAQSKSICRYLARAFGFAGIDLFESAVIDSLADQQVDYCNEIKPWYVAHVHAKPGDASDGLDQLKNDVLLPARDRFLGFITRFLKQNADNGYLVGNKVSWVDLLISEHTFDLSKRVPEYLDGFLEVKAHMEKIHQIPQIKNWLDTRPETIF
ncbi:unnamed protein product [Nippostrongylus brasiliensis]|uniref:glutathione transferase n=1 Tax=Nippostrongylus brasiliensis TaxID=27835 RepID=A0A0N4Y1Z4_NIPBR|nr:hypothetical protein Q1695_012002 [Nippostrongylus brasiliensis]VDL73267.1 unnamed protein product [Nippostrongylus brasiliensis]